MDNIPDPNINAQEDLHEDNPQDNIELETSLAHFRLSDNAAIRGKELKVLRDAVVVDFRKSYNVLEAMNTSHTENLRETHGMLLGHIRNHPGVQAAEEPRPPQLNVIGAISSSPSLVTFSGMPGIDFASWCRTLEDAINASNPPLTADAKRAVLLAYLRDSARDKAAEILDANATFQDIIRELDTTFTNPQHAEIARQRLRNAHQEQLESVDDFATRIRKLARPAHPGQQRAALDDRMKESFLDGLRFDVKFHCKSARPTSFEDALTKALHFEALLSECARANTMTPALVNAAVPQQGPEPMRNRFGDFQSNHRARFDNRSREPHINHRHRFNNHHNSGYNNPHGSRFPRNRGAIVCNNCRYEGHVRRYCPFDDQNSPVPRYQHPSSNHVQQPSFAPSNRPKLPNQMALQVCPDQLTPVTQQMEALRLRNQELSDLAYGRERSHKPPLINSLRCFNPTLLCLLLIFGLVLPAHSLSPLLCNPHAPTELWKLPTGMDCTFDSVSPKEKPSSLSLSIFRPNTVEYESPGYLCKIVKQTMSYSVSFFGYRDSSIDTQHLTVSRDVCSLMASHKHCDHGDLIQENGIWKTSNTLSVSWPSAPFGSFQGTLSTSVTNCIFIETSVRSRYDQVVPETPIASMQGCNFTTGFCNLRSGDAVVWQPDAQQQCRFIQFTTLKGTRLGSIWISSSNELALSWNSSSPVIKNCGEKLAITDQGFAIGSYNSRSKRALIKDAGLVTSNQLSSQLLALESTQRHFTNILFAHTARSLCNAFNSYVQLTLEGASTNPTLSLRRLLKKPNLKGSYIGNGYAMTTPCMPLPSSAYRWYPFDKVCCSRPRIQIIIPASPLMEAFVDPLTMIISDRAHEVNCNHTSTFTFAQNGTIVEYNPLSGIFSSPDTSTVREIQLGVLHFDSSSTEAVIFHNLIIGNLSDVRSTSGFATMWDSSTVTDSALAEAVSRSAHPADGSPLQQTNWHMPSVWSTIFGEWTLFDIWSLACCLYVSVTVTLALAKLALRLYFPQLNMLSTLRPSTYNPTPVTNPRPASIDISYIYRNKSPSASPQINAVFGPTEYFVAQVPVDINGIRILALIDTGASITVANKELCTLLGVTTLQHPQTNTALGIGGSTITMTGCSTATITIASVTINHPIHFTSQPCTASGPNNYEIILGNDFLRKLPPFHLDYSQGTFHCAGSNIPLGHQYNTCTVATLQPVNIRVIQNTVIPPASEAFVKCYIEGPVSSPFLVITTQRSSSATQDLTVNPAVIRASSPTILLTNSSNQPKQVFKGMRIASAEPMPDDTQCF